jgi:thiol-disulfide isomerase/thioredoxin
MALTPSTMLPLGTPLPWTAMAEGLAPVIGGPLPEAGALEGKPVLVLFLCPHCPFVKHVEPELTRLHQDFGDQVAVLAIRSNSLTTHPQDGPEGMAAQATSRGWRFPYLADDSQAVARAFQAACTPDFYLFDGDHRLHYRGQLDGSRPGNAIPLDGRDLRTALTALLAFQPRGTAEATWRSSR